MRVGPAGAARAARTMMAALLAMLFAMLVASSPRAIAAEPPVVLVVGDSISAAYGIAVKDGWVALLERRLAEHGFAHRVVNASISGDTTRGGVSRLPGALERHRPAVVAIELGGNDGLRGIRLDVTRKNLETMVDAAKGAGARVVLLGMRLPPNLGAPYTEAFHALFAEVARSRDTALVPFLLEGVGGVDDLMQDDGLHPTAAAQARLLDNAWPAIVTVLEE